MYETELEVIPTGRGAEDQIYRPIVRATAVVEQRVSHFLMGLGIIGTMTGPLLTVLGTMPRAIFCGVFFVVGVGFMQELLVVVPSCTLTDNLIVGLDRE